MGFWDELKQAFTIVGDIGLGIGKTVAAGLTGFMEGGPLGAIIGAVPAAISGISQVASRVNSYTHPVDDKTNLPNYQTVASVVHPLKQVMTMNQALQTATPQSPDSVQQIAGSMAAFHDGFSKYGNVLGASKAAGATPISQHLANNMSGAIASNLQSKTGFNASNALRYGDSALRSAQMLSSTSMYHAPVMSYLNYGGQEALAMRTVAARGGYGGSPDYVLGGG